jgi:hypothetical protein
MGYDFSDLNDTVIDVFAEAAVITVNGVPAPEIQAVFFAPWSEVQIGKTPIDRTNPRLVGRTSDIAPLNPQPGDTVTVGGRNFEIVGEMNQDGGMTEIALRETS